MVEYFVVLQGHYVSMWNSNDSKVQYMLISSRFLLFYWNCPSSLCECDAFTSDLCYTFLGYIYTLCFPGQNRYQCFIRVSRPSHFGVRTAFINICPKIGMVLESIVIKFIAFPQSSWAAELFVAISGFKWREIIYLWKNRHLQYWIIQLTEHALKSICRMSWYLYWHAACMADKFNGVNYNSYIISMSAIVLDGYCIVLESVQ